MKFYRHEDKCFGFLLWKWKLRIELWIINPWFTIKPHTHPEQDVKLIHIFSDAYIYRIRPDRIDQMQMKPFRQFLKSFTIKANDKHGFTSFRYPFIFINVMKSLSSSPIENFKLS